VRVETAAEGPSAEDPSGAVGLRWPAYSESARNAQTLFRGHVARASADG